MEKMSTKLLLSLLGIVTSLFLGMFVISVDMNKSAIAEINERSMERSEQIRNIYRTQAILSESVIKVSAKVDALAEVVGEVKDEMREVRRAGSRRRTTDE